MVTQIREKGQVTIPVNIRESLHLSQNSLLSIAKVGNAILLVPGSSVFEDVSAKFSKAAQDKGITLESLLKDLKKLRRKE